MQFKYPGLDAAIVTCLWIAAIPLSIWVAIDLGYVPWYVVASSVTGFAALGMWFRLIPAGYIFAIVNILLSVVGVLGMLLNGYSLHLLARAVFNAYSAYVALVWARSDEDLELIE